MSQFIKFKGKPKYLVSPRTGKVFSLTHYKLNEEKIWKAADGETVYSLSSYDEWAFCHVLGLVCPVDGNEYRECLGWMPVA